MLRVKVPSGTFPAGRATLPVQLADGTIAQASLVSADGDHLVLDAPADARLLLPRPGMRTSPDGLHWDSGMWVQSTG